MRKKGSKKLIDSLLNNLMSNYDLLQKGKVVETTNKFKAKFGFEKVLNRPVFKIFSDYFNILIADKEMQKKQGITVLGLLKDEDFHENLHLHESYGKKNVLIEYQGFVVNILFDLYKQNNEVNFYFYMSSSERTYIDSESFYSKIWANAVESSDLKGSYFVMDRDEIQWSKKNIEKRGFSDIYLPKSTIESLKLYVATHTETQQLMRYLMVGNPGTGKTESTLVLANELHKMGVTIIKTPVCSMIKEKVELASLLAPSLIIFDDIDLSLGSRKSGVAPERLQDFLDVLDGTDKMLDNVGMIATTNSVALLDLAAQRPGRFDKVLSFDELTLDNIKNIILKSLKYNFKLPSTGPVAKMFADPQVVKLFKDSKVTGAHIFNSVKMLKRTFDLLKIESSVKVITEELTKEIKTIDKIRQADYLSDKLNNGRQSVGFNNNNSDDDEDEDDEIYYDPLHNKNNLRLSMAEATKIVEDGLFDKE